MQSIRQMVRDGNGRETSIGNKRGISRKWATSNAYLQRLQNLDSPMISQCAIDERNYRGSRSTKPRDPTNGAGESPKEVVEIVEIVEARVRFRGS
jgi:hypothetical protein